jgi:hypothetical protein
MIFSDGDKFNQWLILMILPGTPLSPTKKRTLFSRLSLSEPTININMRSVNFHCALINMRTRESF